MRAFLLVLTTICLVACSSLSEEKSKVEQMQSQVKDYKLRLKALHQDSLPMTTQDISSRLKTITDNFNARNVLMDKELSIMLADFKVYTKVFKGLPQKRMKLGQEIEISRSQLEDLANDIKEKAITKEQVAKYIGDEEQALSTIKTSLDKLDTLMTRGKRGYLRMVPEVDSVIQNLEPLPSE